MNLNQSLKKPLCCFDVETTGVEVATDRIIQLAMAVYDLDGSIVRDNMLIDPGIPIPNLVTEITGITDDDVRGKPKFSNVAKHVHAAISRCDLVGFNLLNFDIPLLWEEFHRCGINWDLKDTKVIDVGNIFKKKEPRTLEAAVKKFCGREHTDAHDALADVTATMDVLLGQRAIYSDLAGMNVDALDEFSRMDELDKLPVTRVDLAGLLVRDTFGVVRYTHKKVRGVAVQDDPGYAQWMLRSAFSENTKIAIRKVFEELWPPTPAKATDDVLF